MQTAEFALVKLHQVREPGKGRSPSSSGRILAKLRASPNLSETPPPPPPPPPPLPLFVLSPMEYDYRNRTGAAYRPGVGGGAASLYPRVGQPGHPPVARAPYLHPSSSAPPSSGLGIRVTIKPEYQITPPPQLAPLVAEVPRSTFQFDFDFEKKILAEAERESQNWSKFAVESQSSKTAASTSGGSTGDPVVDKYVASGLGREAVSLAVLNYGDNPTKVREFVKGYNLLREMGFSSKNVAEALAMYDNDTDKALAYFLNSSS